MSLPHAIDPPPGFRILRELGRRPGLRVLLAEDGEGREVVLRLEPEGGEESLAELAVLAAVDHPGLARLEDFGSLPGGGVWVSRAFAKGEDLSAFAARVGPEELGAAIVELARALDHLHRRGFVHGDLKPANVVVGDDGRPRLLDYGLATRSGGTTSVSGTLVAIAPERLAGAPPEPASDLFSLGATMVELFARRPDPTTFYASFPERPFLEAAGIERDAFPSGRAMSSRVSSHGDPATDPRGRARRAHARRASRTRARPRRGRRRTRTRSRARSRSARGGVGGDPGRAGARMGRSRGPRRGRSVRARVARRDRVVRSLRRRTRRRRARRLRR
ncbi:MAG: protein kinase [Planctomycetota bacterium]